MIGTGCGRQFCDTNRMWKTIIISGRQRMPHDVAHWIYNLFFSLFAFFQFSNIEVHSWMLLFSNLANVSVVGVKLSAMETENCDDTACINFW